MATIQLYVVIFLSIFVGWASFSDSNIGERWAILVAGSQEWGNYPHQADICHAYQILMKGGLKEENIIVFMYDDMAYHKRNPKPGKIYNEKNGKDVYHGVPKDYTGKYVTSLNFYNVLRGHTDYITSNMKVLKSSSNDNVFIYFTGHGNKNYLAMPRKGDRVHRDDLLSIFKYMHRAKLYRQMVIYVDACYSGSMFEDATVLDDLNIFAVTSTNSSQNCYFRFWNERWHIHFSTRFGAAWMKDSKSHNLRNTTFNQQYERVKKMLAKDEYWGQEVVKYGSETVGKRYVSEFFQRAKMTSRMKKLIDVR